LFAGAAFVLVLPAWGSASAPLKPTLAATPPRFSPVIVTVSPTWPDIGGAIRAGV
jgi:hypothetical protein